MLAPPAGGRAAGIAVRKRFRTRRAEGPADLARIEALRAARFRGDAGARDLDAFDARAIQVMVEEIDTGRLAACFRLLPVEDLQASYAGQFYGLEPLASYPGPMAELGRFCVAAGEDDPAVLRLAWGALAAEIEAREIALVFGCASFRGAEAEAHAEAFALLRARHLGPSRWAPRVKAPAVFRFARAQAARGFDLAAGLKAMPPLLRSYLALGGWVSDHAVVDRDLGTTHVFTALETRAIPPARLRVLRAG